MKQNTLEGRAKTKNGVKRLCFSVVCILLEVLFCYSYAHQIEQIRRICQFADKDSGRRFGFGTLCIQQNFVYENAVDNFDTYISDNGSWFVLDDWIKRRNS